MMPRFSSWRSFTVQFDQTLQDFVIRDVVWPAVGVEYCCVEIVVELLKNGDNPLLVNKFVLRIQRLFGSDLCNNIILSVIESDENWDCCRFR